MTAGVSRCSEYIGSMKLLKLLADCGLTEKQARTYLALLELGSSTISPIARLAGVKRTSIYNFMESLIDLGVVGRVKKGGRWYYHAEPPDRLLQIQQARVQALEAALPGLRRAYQGRHPKPAVTYFEGPHEVRNILREELSCKKEALYIWPAKDSVPMTGGVAYLTNLDRQRIERGVWVRSIHFRDKQVYLETGGVGKRFLREMRFAPPGIDITMGVGIYDCGTVGFFSSQGEGFGTLIQSEELCQVMRVLFRSFWARCEAP